MSQADNENHVHSTIQLHAHSTGFLFIYIQLSVTTPHINQHKAILHNAPLRGFLFNCKISRILLQLISKYTIHLYKCMFSCLFMFLFLYVCMYVSIYLPIYLVSLSVRLSSYLSVCLSVFPSKQEVC